MRAPLADKPAALELHAQTGGAGRPVLLLHGLFGALGNLVSLARELNAGYQSVRVDLRNHGRSPHAGAMDYPTMAADVLRLLDSRGIDSCAILGHSMGGKVAMELALTHPARVAALVVADIAPVAYAPDRHDAVFGALRAVPLDELHSRQQADQVLARTLADPGLRQFLLTNLYRDDDRYAWRINLDVLHARRSAIAAAPPAAGVYGGPVLFVKGSESDYIGDASSSAIRARFPAARLHIVQGAGHWLHAEKPAAFNRAVLRFLGQNYPRQ